jgi:endonuclease-3
MRKHEALTMETRAQKRSRLKKIMTALKKSYPDARLALDYSSPLELLIALILAAQARDDVVNSVTSKVFAKYRTAADWADASTSQLESELRQINFYRRKTAAIQQACRELVTRFGGEVPANLDDLLTLPGVGRKTANIVLGNAFGEDVIGVDTHVARLAGRLGFSTQSHPDKIEADLAEIVPRRSAVKLCHLLQFHGRRVCQAKKPACEGCSVRRLCLYG